MRLKLNKLSLMAALPMLALIGCSAASGKYGIYTNTALGKGVDKVEAQQAELENLVAQQRAEIQAQRQALQALKQNAAQSDEARVAQNQRMEQQRRDLDERQAEVNEETMRLESLRERLNRYTAEY